MGYGTFRSIKPMSGTMPSFGDSGGSRPQVQQPMQQGYAMAGMQAPTQQPLTQQFMQSGAMPMSSQAPQSQYMQSTQQAPQQSMQPQRPTYAPTNYTNPTPINPIDPRPPRSPIPINPIDPRRPTPAFNAQQQWNAALMSLYGSGGYDDGGNYISLNTNNYNDLLASIGGYAGINQNRWNSNTLMNMIRNSPTLSYQTNNSTY